MDLKAGKTDPCSDYGNAEFFLEHFGREVRFNKSSARWLVWDGRRWTFDDAAVKRHAIQAMRLRLEAAQAEQREAAAEHGSAKSEATEAALARAGKFVAWAVSSQSEKRLRALLAIAQVARDVCVDQSALDCDQLLFNCANGTIELTTGRLRPHDRADLITKLSPVAYDATATSPLWERVLNKALGSDRTVIDFLQRFAGYCLTGSTEEEKLTLAHGPPAASKSTILEAVKAAMGEYAATADFESFIAKSGDGGIRNDIARLAGARLVLSIEVDEGKKLAEGLVKMLTGGDTVTARFLYREAFEFRPTFKLCLVVNHAPKVSDEDAAMWRRILRIPFEHSVPKKERDPKVKSELLDTKKSGPAILAWAVAGCLKWQKDGLQIPDAVEKATEQYRESQDPLRDFFDECCVFGNDQRTVNAWLRAAYEQWCRDNGTKYPLSPNAFAQRLESRACERIKFRPHPKADNQRGWSGISVKGHVLVAEDEGPGHRDTGDTNFGNSSRAGAHMSEVGGTGVPAVPVSQGRGAA